MLSAPVSPALWLFVCFSDLRGRVSALFALSSMWYKREEKAQIVTYWYIMNGGQQIVGGLLAYCFSLIHHGPLKAGKPSS